MKTAWIHIDDIAHSYVPLSPRGELEGLARVYKLSEPHDFDGDGIPDEYVVARILYRREHMHAEIALLPCTEHGALTGPHGVMRRMGSFPLVPCPQGNPDAIEYAIGVAFAFSDFTVVDAPEEEEAE